MRLHRQKNVGPDVSNVRAPISLQYRIEFSINVILRETDQKRLGARGARQGTGAQAELGY